MACLSLDGSIVLVKDSFNMIFFILFSARFHQKHILLVKIDQLKRYS